MRGQEQVNLRYVTSVDGVNKPHEGSGGELARGFPALDHV